MSDIITVRHSSADAHCCKGDERYEWQMPFSEPCSFSTIDYVGDLTPPANLEFNLVKDGVSTHRST